jgi:hypothetical protein
MKEIRCDNPECKALLCIIKREGTTIIELKCRKCGRKKVPLAKPTIKE